MVDTSQLKMDWKRLATIAVIGILLGLAIAIWRAGNEDIPQPTGVQTITKGVAEGRRAQFASWEFTYNRATTLPDNITQEIDGVHDGVYYRGGKPFVRMRADRVLYNTLSHDFTVAGPVHFEVADKGKTRILDTQDATWNDALQTLRVPGKATIQSEGGSQLVVTQLTIDLRNGEYKLGSAQGGYTP